MRVLLCPLNWGLGHASRDIVIIRRFLQKGHEVVIAADGPALEMLKTEFPHLAHICFPSTRNITYFRKLPAWFKIFLMLPFLGYGILSEHARLKKIVFKTPADLIISDNRYGLWHPVIPSVLITHQLNPKLPRFIKFLEPPLARMMRLMIHRFDRCWIPDFPGDENISGDLAHKYSLPRNAVFTGVLSRFMFEEGGGSAAGDSDAGYSAAGYSGGEVNLAIHQPGNDLIRPDGTDRQAHTELVIIISGPEPQRTLFEKVILDQVKDIPHQAVILQGLPGKIHPVKAAPNIRIFSHLQSEITRSLLENAKYIICRGGYTSIMDLITLGKPAMIIPTPGQTEQEYLACYLSSRGIILTLNQKSFDLKEAVRQLETHKATAFPPGDQLLEKELDRWL